MRHVAVIDIGKTNAKLAIVDIEQRREIKVLSCPNQVIDGPPYPHFDTDSLWRFVISGLTSLAKSYAISDISITTHGACAVLLNCGGELACPILDYEYDGPDVTRLEYQNIRPSFEQTGSPFLANGLNLGAQLYWLFNQHPKLLKRVSTIVMYPQYWAYRLCGFTANDPTSLGCHTDLWNPVLGEFTNLVDSLKIRGKMAGIKSPMTKLGSIKPELAGATGLDAATSVYCGIHDSNASLYNHIKRIDPPFAVVSTGTWVVCMSTGAGSNHLVEARDTLLNVSATGGVTPSSRFMGGREYEYLVQKYAAIETVALTQRVLDLGAHILPSVESLSGPYQGADYRWTVDPNTLSPEERYNVISFYLGMMTCTCLSLCSTSGPVVVEGPFAKNQLYCALLAAVTGRAILGDVSSSTGTSVGAAMLVLNDAPGKMSNEYCSLATQPSTHLLRGYGEDWFRMVKDHIGIAGSIDDYPELPLA